MNSRAYLDHYDFLSIYYNRLRKIKIFCIIIYIIDILIEEYKIICIITSLSFTNYTFNETCSKLFPKFKNYVFI